MSHDYQPPQAGYPPQAFNPEDLQITKYAGEMPDDDLRDDTNVTEPSAPSPPEDMLDSYSGYGRGFEETPCGPPPSYAEAMEPSAEEKPEIKTSELEEGQVKDALADYVGEHCCWSKGPLEDMSITEMQPSSAFHYKLDSFVEYRSTKWKFEPYHGQSIQAGGPPPMPWDIPVQPKEMFKKDKEHMEVPFSASIKPCHSCHGSGLERCFKCQGRGMLLCNLCSGAGSSTVGDEIRTCSFCNGQGRSICHPCNGMGQNRCNICQGHRNLKCYIELEVKWKIHDDEHVAEHTALPSDLIKSVSGQTALLDTRPRVWPVTNFPEKDINDKSVEFVNKHATKYNDGRILMQKQQIEIVPVTHVLYSWKGETYDFYVYGKEKKVHHPDYPAKCGCAIL